MSHSILVTGGAGYLGSTLVPALLAAGHKVTVLDNFMFRQSPLNQLCAEPGFDVVRGDARDEAVLRPLLREADIFIPLAALVGAPLCDNDKPGAESINLDAVRTAIGLMSPQQRILMPTTNSGYGIGEPGQALHRGDAAPADHRSMAAPRSRRSSAVLDRGNAISFRLATVFGMSPRMRIDLLVNDFVYRAVTDRAVVLFEAHFKRNYIHVRDVARAFLHGIENFESMRDQPYNVGLSDANLSKLELCQRIQAPRAEVRLPGGADRRRPRQAGLHRLQCPDRGHRLPPPSFAR